jgi:hypothetical protein
VHFLGLGYESDQFDINKAEMRRRAFWVAQVMDQWLSSCTGGHRLIQQPSDAKRWDCRWPQLEDNQLCALSGMQPTQSCFTVESALQMTSFKEMIRLSQIVRDMCDGARVEANLTEWLLHLPCYLDYGKPSHDPSPLAKVYRILYYTVQIMLCRQQANQGLSISICTTAANTIIHIAEQMLEQKQDKFLHNLFSLSVTLATSIHLESASDTTPVCLYKSVSILKSINCTLLSSDYFDKLVDHFMTDLAPHSLKRARSPQQQQPSYDLLDTPFSFDLNDILLTDTFAPNLIDSNAYSPWFDFFEPFDPNPDSSCSSISLFTPSQSPTLSLDCQKELDVLSSPSFFSSFV